MINDRSCLRKKNISCHHGAVIIWKKKILSAWLTLFLWISFLPVSTHAAEPDSTTFPRPLDAYPPLEDAGILQSLSARVAADPFNLVATLIFFCAIVHTFMVSRFQHWAHRAEREHREKLEQTPQDAYAGFHAPVVSFKAQVLHYLGEVEAVFGTWVLALALAITCFKGWDVFINYVGTVNFTEAIFVVIIMAIASTRPILQLATRCLGLISQIGKNRVSAWWLTILIVAPILGSLITEPAAMTIAALLLAREFYRLKPGNRLCHATLGLLFVNVSVGGTLTHFAAPPVLIVAAKWGWDTPYMFMNFGWKACVGIIVSTLLYYLIFRKELRELEQKRLQSANAASNQPEQPIPFVVSFGQLCFLGAVVYFGHYPALCIGTFLFFIAYNAATYHHQGAINLRSPMLVGFFISGLLIHGGLQGWWIEPILGSLGEKSLFLSSTLLTAFNDNASITYLSSLVPGFSDQMKYAVMAGAVTGGGLTVIANAPNPAGQNLLQTYFPEGISPLGLLLSALPPTLLMAACFILL